MCAEHPTEDYPTGYKCCETCGHEWCDTCDTSFENCECKSPSELAKEEVARKRRDEIRVLTAEQAEERGVVAEWSRIKSWDRYIELELVNSKKRTDNLLKVLNIKPGGTFSYG